MRRVESAKYVTWYTIFPSFFHLSSQYNACASAGWCMYLAKFERWECWRVGHVGSRVQRNAKPVRIEAGWEACRHVMGWDS